ncbi:MAG TPA: PIN domain-containing protein [Thermoanaerobaculia bacterium]|jgi:predicted nucleic acid-binding protein|nr:PIN domain-containing protein [Thermoanaerobaculia bacterium]
MRLLLDTNTLSYLIKGTQPALDRLEKSIEDEAAFLLAPVVEYELTRYLDLRGMPRLVRNYLKITSSWQRCDLAFNDWREAARLWAERHRVGQSISDLDLLLAVLARREGAVLVTSNTRHFQGLGVDLQDWMVSP